jgi:hypothetical protein
MDPALVASTCLLQIHELADDLIVVGFERRQFAAAGDGAEGEDHVGAKCGVHILRPKFSSLDESIDIWRGVSKWGR